MINKLFIVLTFLLLTSFFPTTIFARSNSYVSIVNPVRGDDFRELKDQDIEVAVRGQIEILDSFTLPVTWLLRFDSLDDRIINEIKNRSSDEKGLFLEVTPTWTNEAKIQYHKSDSWHSAGSAFLTGYEREEREKLIDTAFEKFKKAFGYYPVSVGAWWIDSFSLSYMQKKYGISAALIVADQYSTDNYQIWGQYFSTPYYPSPKNALNPAQSIENKLPVVIMQWAARDPVNAYGKGVEESTYSVQANDYIDYHNLNTDYFSFLVDLYIQQQFNQFGHLVVGLENSYQWNKYASEYKNQMQVLSDKKKNNQLAVVVMKDFANWYKSAFPNLSPTHLIVTNDPLGSYKKVVWFMNPYFRAGWFLNQDGSVFRDIRQYIEGDEEICFRKKCDQVNFATFATRVLDEVTYGNKWVIDEGRISDFKIFKEGGNFVITYENEAGNNRRIEFLPRDIGVDGKISSIDGAILDAIKQDTTEQKKIIEFKGGWFSWTALEALAKVIKFSLFLIFACLLPGLVLVNRLEQNWVKKIFLSEVIGLVSLTLIFYVTSLLNVRYLTFIYILLHLYLFLRLKYFSALKFSLPNLDKITLVTFLVIAAGTIFQNIPTFKSGLTYQYGLGFWGPNAHDGIWHISLINQLVKNVPPQNPIFADTTLKNYHFFYDLLVAATAFFTKIPILDLTFRFYPILLSLSLGIGTYFFANTLFKNRIAAIFSLYFVYFAGSFGWIVDYIKNKSFGGESAFWANQSISFNLNPPYASSLLIIIAFLLSLTKINRGTIIRLFILVLLLSSLTGFKSYGAVLTIVSLSLIAFIKLFKRQLTYLYVCVFSIIFSIVIFLSNFEVGQQLIIFSPFWLIHSMIDSPDRIGWTRLTLARISGMESKNWFKFISAETIGLAIFILGNLGVRFLSLFSLSKIKQILKDTYLLFLLIFCLLSFLIPVIFIQSGNPWNTIQFSYYGFYMAAVISGIVLYFLMGSIPKFFSSLLLLSVVLLTPINSITTASYYTGELPHAVVESKELEALEVLSKREEGIVLTYPYDNKLQRKIAEPWPLFAYVSSAYVSALSGKAVYLEDEPQNQILLTDYKKRLVASKDFFSNPNIQKVKFLSDNNIKYIYLPKVYNLRLDELTQVLNIFENEAAIIYKVK